MPEQSYRLGTRNKQSGLFFLKKPQKIKRLQAKLQSLR